MSHIAVTTLLSAILLFVIQPLVAKELLPLYGGSAAVWGVCLFFFQSLLLAGYAYAHFLGTMLPAKTARCLHLFLLGTAIYQGQHFLVAPTLGLASNETLGLLSALSFQVGLPYFALTATSPLLQAWFHGQFPERSVYRLYALSNIGSFVGLFSYPFLLEPYFNLQTQKEVVALFFVGFVVLLALLIVRTPDKIDGKTKDTASKNDANSNLQAAWIFFPALASLLLVSLTAYLCHDLVSFPLLWTAPLGLYLLSFVVAFEKPSWYRRPLYFSLALFLVLAICDNQIAGVNARASLAISAVLVLVFIASTICHAELAARKPGPHHLTKFYLAMALGSALGSLSASVLAPLIFPAHFEMHVGLVGLVLTCLWGATFLGAAPGRVLRLSSAFVLLAIGVHAYKMGSNALILKRNFYGVLRVAEERNSGQVAFRGEYHGRILHGIQLVDPGKEQQVLGYYAPGSGVYQALASIKSPRSVGIVGLGVGSLAGLALSGDQFTFYELNPLVWELAQTHFTFLSQAQGKVHVVLGDARQMLASQMPQSFDALVVDAFNGDAIPVHLLTKEAISLYLQHLKPDGLLLMHISNRHLNLLPVLKSAAKELNLDLRYLVQNADKSMGIFESEWVALAASPSALRWATPTSQVPDSTPEIRWTDDHSSLISVFK